MFCGAQLVPGWGRTIRTHHSLAAPDRREREGREAKTNPEQRKCISEISGGFCLYRAASGLFSTKCDGGMRDPQCRDGKRQKLICGDPSMALLLLEPPAIPAGRAETVLARHGAGVLQSCADGPSP